MSSRKLSLASEFTVARVGRGVAFFLGFSLPVSNTLMNIALGLALVCAMPWRNFRNARVLFRSPLVWIPALLFVMLAVSLLTHHHAYGPKMVEKYKKLLYILPLALFFITDPRLLARFVQGFLWANGVILLISLASGVFHLTLAGLDPFNPTVFKLQITQNVFMAFAALLWIAGAFRQPGKTRWIPGVLALLAAINVLLMVQGRTGYVALFVGVGMWLLLSLAPRPRVAVFSAGLIAVILLCFLPNRALDRVTLGLMEIQHCLQAPAGQAYQMCDNSMGQRTAFARESLRLIKQAAFLGNGAGSFWYGNAATGYSIHNPHNEYLLQTVHNGLIGLALFLGWMFFCFRAACRQPPACRNVLIALLSSYMVCNLFNSFILDSAEGHLFVTIVAILAGSATRAATKPAGYPR